ncbi:26S proteasome regulatory complex, non-ATPase subcomplex, Rpn2/Psmd1 subunit, partial [Anaeromyces robustus]
AGVISLLDESEELQIYALKKLNTIVDQFWAEISDSVSKIEVLYEDEQFKYRNLAALVASKVYYHLGEFDESMSFALGAGDLFDSSLSNEYVETIVAKCIDHYIFLRSNDRVDEISPELEQIIEKVFERCFTDKEYKQAIGIALESLRLDIIEKAIKAGDSKELLSYVLNASMTLVQNLNARNEVLKLLVELYKNLDEPDYISMTQCFLHLKDSYSCAETLKSLVNGDEKQLLMAYQIAFDLEENATQDFLQQVLDALPAPAPKNEAEMETDDKKPSDDPISKIRSILEGDLSIKLNLEFLFRNIHTDLQILNATKDALDSRNSMYHSAITFANAFMNSGTTSDEFLRNNLEWLSRASNWSKFSATAALGVIHKGHIDQGLKLLAPYLPQDGVSSSPYSEGGSLFALGLINANHGGEVLDYLRNALNKTQNEIIQHGAALGLGAAGMAIASDDIYEELKNVLFTDSAVAGEAAGLAMGLIMLGTSSEKAIDEMLQYAHETQHEKIIRGLAIGMALIMYGKEDTADTLIEQLLQDKDHIIRYGGIYMIALAYCGTGNNKAIKKCLHVAVSDVNDDVRSAAVIALGFILFKTPKQVPRIVQLLAESYNPHVRYGCTLALGISCAGTAMPEAMELLEPLTKDQVDFVKQGALIASAMVLIQSNETMAPKVASIRKLYETIIKDKHEEAMAKFGAVLSQGILDAGGRNVTISLQSRSGYNNMASIVGMTIFTQFWYWYPLSHFLSLAFTPTAFIGLNSKLEMPKLEFISNAKPSLFAYPSQMKKQAPTVVEKVATAVLSTTAKTKARAKKNEKEKGGNEPDTMDTDEKKEETQMDVDTTEKKEEEVEKQEKKKKQTFEKLGNLTRVLPAQLKYIVFKEDSRYIPVKKDIVGGITIMEDRHKGEPEELLEFSTPSKFFIYLFIYLFNYFYVY